MTNRPAPRLSVAKRIGLAITGVMAIPTLVGIASAQVPSDLRFEVASVRRVEIQTTVTGGVPVFPPTGGVGTSDPSRIAYRGTWLLSLIVEAFGVRADQISGPDGWSKDRYDVVANIPPGTTKEQYKVMLGNLLRDRFHLRFHLESKVQPVYVLRVGKNGPKFKESGAASDPNNVGEIKMGVEGFPVMPPGRRGMVSMPRPGEMLTTAQDVSMPELASSLDGPAKGVGRPVLDETGLTGRYDFRLRMQYGPVTGLGDAPSVFTAVEEQLGLKLESANRPLDQFIIESIDREPTEN